MKTTCLTLLGAYVFLALGLSAWFYLQFPHGPAGSPSLLESSYRARVALGVGFLDAIPAMLTLSLLYDCCLRLWRRSLLARAAAGEPQADGKQGVFYGTIHRDGPPLTAPLTRRECLLYRYEVTASTVTRSGVREPTTTTSSYTAAEGFALTPSTIHTASQSVKLATLVRPEFPPDVLELEQVAGNYEAYAATVRLQASTLRSKEAVLRSLYKRPRAEIRYDLGPASRELRTCAPYKIEEQVVQDGDTVAVFGKYSASLGAIVDERDSALGTRLHKGPLDGMQKRLARSALWFALGSIFFCALAAAGAWAFFAFGPPEVSMLRSWRWRF